VDLNTDLSEVNLLSRKGNTEASPYFTGEGLRILRNSEIFGIIRKEMLLVTTLL
jgi:hypothetical protein